MCTVVIRVPESAAEPTRVLAIRDEDPERPWNPLGRWWPEPHDGVVGVRDVRAGGAWLAADPETGRLAVLLNRADETQRPESELQSRGGIVLDSVAGHSPAAEPATHGFNLVEVEGARARVLTWDGVALRTTDLAPGTHMIAHDDVDDTGTPRIARWLGEFQSAAPASEGRWWMPWVDVLRRSEDGDRRVHHSEKELEMQRSTGLRAGSIECLTRCSLEPGLPRVRSSYRPEFGHT